MKRLLTSAALLLCSLITFAQFSGSGSGTEDDPYLIFNDTQLSQVSNFLNQEGVVFSLMKDLDLTNWIEENNPRQGWLPIGVESMPFMGKFLGNNHKISGLMIKRSSTEYVGFFGYVSDATIENLTIEGSSITGASNVGGFIGYVIRSEITNCRISLTSGVEGLCNVGGFVGQSINTNFSSFNVETSVSAQNYLGGFVGKAEGGTWQQGNNTGQFTCSGNYAGGFGGQLTSVSITGIKQNGDISGQNYIGGFVGCCSTGTFTNCYVGSNVQGVQYVSGFAGALENTTSSFNTCFHKGIITANGDYAGGIVGISKGGCIEEMESCSHFGDMKGNNFVGGIIGAVLNENEEPTLYIYTLYRSKDGNSPYGKLLKTIKETILNGQSISAPINNCTSICNIEGKNWIGGLIGSDVASHSYSPKAITTSFQNSGYLFKDGVYTGQYVLSSDNLSHSYTRNTVSHSFTNNYFSGTIHGTNNIGGLCGYKSGGSIQNNYAYGNIFGVENVGGIVGQINADKIEDSYNTTTIKSNVANISIISATSQNVGRIYGVIDVDYTTIGALGSLESNRALAQAKVILSGVTQEIDDDLQNGTSIGPSALKLKANYVSWGWNFDENWNILETECFPYKKYQAAPPIILSNLVSQATSISGKSLDGGTVYLYYKDRNAVSTECSGNLWYFTTEPLQSGALVQIYADVEGLTPSYFTSANVDYPGSGTEDDPYRIYTAEDLQGTSKRGYYQVMNDIDLTSWITDNSPKKGWVPIGRNSGDATYIDGAGHTISGLWIDSTEDYTGLFSNYSAGQIKNLTVEVTSGKSVKGGNYTGILIGRMANGRIINCQVKGDVEGTQNVGGIIGNSEAITLTTLSFEGMVKATAEEARVGGIAGYAKTSPATNCNVCSTVKATNASAYAGGLMGLYEDGLISKCMTDVTIAASGANSNVGGLVGNLNGETHLSFSKGSVSATGTGSNTGGLVGYAKASTITNCYSTANVNGTDFTAGLVGYAYSSAIDKCYAKGNVTGVQYGAGVVGELEASNATLTNSVAVNNILSLTAQSSWGSRVIGGFKSGAPTPDESNYALSTMQVSLNNVPQRKTDDIVEGIAKTESELKQAATYQALGWDYNEIWGIDEEETYPYLIWSIEKDFIPIADITLDKTSLTIAVGKTDSLTASVLPLNATNKQLLWTTSNPSVASVTDGVVAAVAVGTATITVAATDGSGVSANCQVTVTDNKKEDYANISSDGKTITFYFDGKRSSRSGTTYDLQTSGKPDWSSQAATITKAVFDPSFSFARPVTVRSWFEGMKNLKAIEGLENLNISEAEYTSYMFQNCSSLETLDLSHFDTSKVKLMGYMFKGCSSLKSVDISNFNSGICTSFNSMFYGCSSLESIDLSPLTINDGADSRSMLSGCTALEELTIPSSSNNLNAAAFTTVGTSDAPCIIHAPEGFDFGTDTGSAFLWKGGWFVLFNPATITASIASLSPGNAAQLIVRMNNSSVSSYNGFEMVLRLPEGMSIAKKDNDFDCKLGGRCSGMSVSVSDLGNGIYRIMSFSLSNTTISGTEGALLLLSLSCPENVPVGTYTGTLEDISLSTTAGTGEEPDDVTFPITVSQYRIGDVDLNGKINVIDVMLVVSHILGDKLNNFHAEYADMDGNGKINVLDVTTIIDVILNSPYMSQQAPERVSHTTHLTQLPASGGVVLALDGTERFTACQMDVRIEGGVMLRGVKLLGGNASSHSVKYSHMSNDMWRVVVYSAKGSVLENGAPLLQLLTDGKGNAIIENIEMCSELFESVTPECIEGSATAITEVGSDFQEVPTYTIQGIRIAKPQRGVNIRNGKKVTVK